MSDHLANFRDRKEFDPSDNAERDRRLIELSALFEISQTLNSSLNLKSILSNILLVPMGRMMIGKGLILLNHEGNHFKVETVKGLPTSLYEKEISIPDSPGHAILIENVSTPAEWVDFFRQFKIELLIPFVSRSDTLGLMGFGARITGAQFSEDEIDFLTSLSNIASTAIENALVFERIKKVNRQLDHKIQELNTLFDIGKEFNLSLDHDKILKLLTYALMGQVTVNSYVITLRAEDGSFTPALVKGTAFRDISEKICPDVCSHSGFIHSSYLREDETEFDNLLSEYNIRVVVPMKVQNETRGYIFLGDKITGQPFKSSDLEFLQTLGNVAIISLENARLFQETLEKQRMEEEMALARNIQNRLLPKKMPEFPGLQIHGLNVPSKFVGGDYFDIIRIDEKNIVLTIADVSGKGMPASLLMSNLQASLHSLVGEDYTLDRLVGRINKVIYNNTAPEKYITFFFGRLNLETLEFQFVNAGHNPPFLLRHDESIVELSDGGIILGMMPDMPYEIGTVTLQQGDLLMMYTDGVTEAMTGDDEEYEEERLQAFLRKYFHDKSPEIINQLLIDDLNDFTAGAPQGDDITLLTLKVIAAPNS
jgi:sigma-B regulation protein RsbU (phosphoserine phosphatase)